MVNSPSIACPCHVCDFHDLCLYFTQMLCGVGRPLLYPRKYIKFCMWRPATKGRVLNCQGTGTFVLSYCPHLIMHEINCKIFVTFSSDPSQILTTVITNISIPNFQHPHKKRIMTLFTFLLLPRVVSFLICLKQHIVVIHPNLFLKIEFPTNI